MTATKVEQMASILLDQESMPVKYNFMNITHGYEDLAAAMEKVISQIQTVVAGDAIEMLI